MIQDPQEEEFIEEPVEEHPEKPRPPLRFPYYASYIVVLGMLICLAIAMIDFIQWLVPTWQASGMVVICALAALEAIASHRLIHQLRTAEHQLAYYRLTEWIILIILLKLYTELSLGTAHFAANFNLWLVDFPMNILNGSFFMTLIPVLVVWIVANLFDNDLFLLGNFEQELREEGPKNIIVRNLVLRRFLNIGLLMVVMAGIPPQTVINGPMPPASNAAPAVVMYFIFGIALVSLTRYSYLSAHWRFDRMDIPRQVSSRWALYTIILIVALGVLIFLVPITAGVGLMATISFLFQQIGKLAAIIYALIFIVINFLSRLLLPTRQIIPEPIVPAATPPPLGLPSSEGPSQTWKMVESILFWGALAALIIIALRQYILFNKDLADELKRFRPWRWLVLFWKRITASAKKANQSVGIFVQSSLKRLRRVGRKPADQSDWDVVSPRRLNSRQKIIFYYLALVRRADEAGLPRGQGQTPYEYAQTLSPSLAEGKEAVEALTGSFVEARYSRHAISGEAARNAETLWETARRILRSIRRSKQEKDTPEDS